MILAVEMGTVEMEAAVVVAVAEEAIENTASNSERSCSGVLLCLVLRVYAKLCHAVWV